MRGSRAHAAGAPEGPAVPEPTHAEKARTLAHLGGVGSLATASHKHGGWPFASVMPYVLDAGGRPLFLISAMAVHAKNLLADPRSSLLVTQAADGDPLGAGRVTLMGETKALPDADLQAARPLYLERHPNAKFWIGYGDFAFYRLEVADVYFVGGFGVMGWVAARDYLAAAPDPLAEAAPGILAHLNADHAEALARIARSLGGIAAQEAKITAVDRLGFNLRVKTADKVRGLRLAFPVEVRSAEQARRAFIALAGAAGPYSSEPSSSTKPAE